MQPDFWLERWERGETGFHQAAVNPLLPRHWPAMQVAPGQRVFAPLAGRSVDLAWLRSQGLDVVGVEVSERAVRAFFAERGVTPDTAPAGQFTRWAAEGIELLCGDYFALTPATLGPVAAVYDRAALIALPPDLRRDYAARMATLTPPGARTLLVTLEYEQAQMGGPPFSVGETELRALYGGTHDIELLERCVPEDFPKFRARGLTRLDECAYRLTRR
jgi:thiopurine S-methyltransferase